jgi:membrane-bound lytic murein transglycosylase D
MCIISTYSIADDSGYNFMLMNNYNLRQETSIWQRMRDGFKLNHAETRRVKYYEQLYTRSQKAFNKIVNNARPYIYYILNETERFGLPSELALIPAIETTYDPNAKYTSKTYDGMWQFLPGTGRRFNMNEDDEINERQDIVKSTRAAVTYFSYLYSIFHQWEPAIGAYNCGEGCMYQAILDSGQKIGDVDYSELELPEHAANYVPKLIALANIIENPKRFGIKLADIDNTPYFAITHPTTNTSIPKLQRLANVNDTTFTTLNPQFKDKDLTLTQQNRLLLPINNQKIYYANLEGTTNSSYNHNTLLASNTSTHTVTIDSTQSQPSNTSSTQKASTDTISSSAITAPIVPGTTNTTVAVATTASTPVVAATTTNVTAAPAIVNTVAVESSSTQQLNNTKTVATSVNDAINSDIIAVSPTPDEKNSAPKTKLATTEQEQNLDNLINNLNSADKEVSHEVAHKGHINTAKRINYTVNAGDTLYSIARHFKVSVDMIRKQNHIFGNNLVAGQTLHINTQQTTLADAE